MTRLLGVIEPPFKLLANVEGLEVVQLPFADSVVGLVERFSVKMGEISTEMVNEKVKHIESVNRDYLVGSDYACLMNIGGRLSKTGSKIQVLHIAEILNMQ